eukprot:6467151-Amphidinium_carterae.1
MGWVVCLGGCHGQSAQSCFEVHREVGAVPQQECESAPCGVSGSVTHDVMIGRVVQVQAAGAGVIPANLDGAMLHMDDGVNSKDLRKELQVGDAAP